MESPQYKKSRHFVVSSKLYKKANRKPQETYNTKNKHSKSSPNSNLIPCNVPQVESCSPHGHSTKLNSSPCPRDHSVQIQRMGLEKRGHLKSETAIITCPHQPLLNGLLGVVSLENPFLSAVVLDRTRHKSPFTNDIIFGLLRRNCCKDFTSCRSST